MRQLIAVIFTLLAGAACAGAGGVALLNDQGGGDLDAAVMPDAGLPDRGGPADVPFDPGGPEDSKQEFVSCMAGTGCFGEPCDDGGDCLSGFCVDHMGNQVCSEACVEECPAGWSCQQVSGLGPDLTFVCVSDFRVLCRPCTDNDDCASTSGQEDLCVTYGASGRFCGAACGEEKQCPEGYNCEDVGAAGESLFQCVADAEECECSDLAVELAEHTVCEVSNDFGTCEGIRKCTSGGLTACDADEPAAEQCNGSDDNCDGETDEATCDDDNDCTEDLCEGVDGCAFEPLEGTTCDDLNPCTVTDHCVSGDCVGTAVQCDDGNPCTDDLCDGQSGCIFEANSDICDDGDPCTIGDLCVEGECQGTAVECDCVADTDCAAFEDGDLCNGTLYCDKSGVQFKCAVAPDTIVVCPPPAGPDAACLQASCAPVTGACSLTPANEGQVCSDGDQCTYGESCFQGTCSGGAELNCNDANQCTADSCNPDSGCQHSPVNGGCNDGDSCTGPDACFDGQCAAGPPLNCDDNNQCTADNCDSALGCTHLYLDQGCDDGNQCTMGDHCEGGLCLPSSMLGCDDGNPCTDDSCNSQTGCLHTHNNAACSDGNQCSSNDYCQDGTCQPGEELDCEDNNQCTEDVCNPLLGCLLTNNAGVCDDVDPCTLQDKCSGGVCVGTTPKDCNDDNPCTDDKCIPMAGCSYDNNDNPCDDGNSCTTGDKCAAGSCQPGEPSSCEDGNVCTDDACVQGEGCVHEPNDAGCDDLNECTTGDTCKQGQCSGTGSLECDDGKPCTKDICLPGGGCLHEDAEAPCSDGDPCTVGDVCEAGECVSGPAPDCDDGNPCTDDSCGADGACDHAPNQAACDDGNPCTIGDHCDDGWCAPEGPLDCNDDNLCTTDNCDPLQGCIYTLNSNPCNDNDACTINDLCGAGSCGGGGSLNCEDANPCTVDSCDPAAGCIHLWADAPCDDFNPCTEGDHCDEGVCKPGSTVGCDDQDVCTDDSCDVQAGCVHTHNQAPCNDLNECTTGDVCAAGVCAGPDGLNCDDGKICTDDSCVPDSGCVHLNNSAPCSDNNSCTEDDSCSGGSCQPGSLINCNDGDECTTDSCDPVQGCIHSNNNNCCSPSGNRVAFNSISQDSAGGCWNGNPCGTDSYSWNGNGQAFSGFGQSITCSGASGCVAQVGITTYSGGNSVCQGKWDVYCNNEKQCTITTLGTSCAGSAMGNGCKCNFPKAKSCSSIKLVSVQDGDGTGSCCGGSPQPDSMITAVSAW